MSMSWVCPQCAYLNQPVSSSCEVCGCTFQESRSRSISRTSSRSSSPSPLRSPSRSPSPSPSRSRSRSRSTDGQERALAIALACPSSLNRNDLLFFLESQISWFPRSLLVLILEYHVHSPRSAALWDPNPSFDCLLPHSDFFNAGVHNRVDVFRARFGIISVDDNSLSTPSFLRAHSGDGRQRSRSSDRGGEGSRNNSPDFRQRKEHQQKQEDYFGNGGLGGEGKHALRRSSVALATICPTIKIQVINIEGDPLSQLDRSGNNAPTARGGVARRKDPNTSFFASSISVSRSRKPSISNSNISDTESEMGDETEDDEELYTPALVHLRQLRIGQELRLSVFVFHGCVQVCPCVDLTLTMVSPSRWTCADLDSLQVSSAPQESRVGLILRVPSGQNREETDLGFCVHSLVDWDGALTTGAISLRFWAFVGSGSRIAHGIHFLARQTPVDNLISPFISINLNISGSDEVASEVSPLSTASNSATTGSTISPPSLSTTLSVSSSMASPPSSRPNLSPYSTPSSLPASSACPPPLSLSSTAFVPPPPSGPPSPPVPPPRRITTSPKRRPTSTSISSLPSTSTFNSVIDDFCSITPPPSPRSIKSNRPLPPSDTLDFPVAPSRSSSLITSPPPSPPSTPPMRPRLPPLINHSPPPSPPPPSPPPRAPPPSISESDSDSERGKSHFGVRVGSRSCSCNGSGTSARRVVCSVGCSGSGHGASSSSVSGPSQGAPKVRQRSWSKLGTSEPQLDSALVQYLLKVQWANTEDRHKAHHVLKMWARPLSNHRTLELLDARFADTGVRAFAVRQLALWSEQHMLASMAVLVQCLKFEAHHDTPLARLLLQRALAAPDTLGHALFHCLLVDAYGTVGVERSVLLLEVLLARCPHHVLTAWRKQREVSLELARIAVLLQKLSPKRGVDADAVLRAELHALNCEVLGRVASMQLPTNLRMRVTHFQAPQCRLLTCNRDELQWLEFWAKPPSPLQPPSSSGSIPSLSDQASIASPSYTSILSPAMRIRPPPPPPLVSATSSTTTSATTLVTQKPLSSLNGPDSGKNASLPRSASTFSFPSPLSSASSLSSRTPSASFSHSSPPSSFPSSSQLPSIPPPPSLTSRSTSASFSSMFSPAISRPPSASFSSPPSSWSASASSASSAPLISAISTSSSCSSSSSIPSSASGSACSFSPPSSLSSSCSSASSSISSSSSAPSSASVGSSSSSFPTSSSASTSSFASTSSSSTLSSRSLLLREELYFPPCTIFRCKDMRNHQAMIQTMRVMDDLWKAAGLDLLLAYPDVVMLGICPETGESLYMNEAWSGATSIENIIRTYATGGAPFRTDILHNYLASYHSRERELDVAIETFMVSLAALLVATYVLGISEQNSSSILVHTSGRVLGVDFSACLGHSPRKYGVRIERPNFHLTTEMSYVIGGKRYKSHPRFKRFIGMVSQGFLVLRQNVGALETSLTFMFAHAPYLNDPYFFDLVRDRLHMEVSGKRALQLMLDELFRSIDRHYHRLDLLMRNIRKN